MTPKDKAIELFDEIDSILFKEYNNLKAKKCALIVVNNILKLDLQEIYMNYDYWKDVKKEIELL